MAEGVPTLIISISYINVGDSPRAIYVRVGIIEGRKGVCHDSCVRLSTHRPFYKLSACNRVRCVNWVTER